MKLLPCIIWPAAVPKTRPSFTAQSFITEDKPSMTSSYSNDALCSFMPCCVFTAEVLVTNRLAVILPRSVYERPSPLRVHDVLFTPLEADWWALTLSFNTIILGCHGLSRYPYVCLAIGRCSFHLTSWFQPPLNSRQCSYVAWRKIPLSKPFIYTHPDFQRCPVLFLSLSVLGQYTISHSSPWLGTHFPITPAKRDWKAWWDGK